MKNSAVPADHVHGPDCGCGHAHLPAAKDLRGDWSFAKAFSLAFAVGIRPCTGAILVLVFANGLGLYWAGIFSTFAMAVGTFITVSVIAAIAVYSKKLAAAHDARAIRGCSTGSASGSRFAGGARHRLSRNDPVPRLVGLHQRHDVSAMQAVRPRKNQWLVLAGCILLCLADGHRSAALPAPASIDGWYRTLAKPSWNPPDWVFGPVWTMLYIMMAVAAWLVWKTRDRVGARHGAVLRAAGAEPRLVAPVLRRALARACADRGGVPVAAPCCSPCWPSSGGRRTAGWLFVPYLAWVSFAAVLNFAIWSMN